MRTWEFFAFPSPFSRTLRREGVLKNSRFAGFPLATFGANVRVCVHWNPYNEFIHSLHNVLFSMRWRRTAIPLHRRCPLCWLGYPLFCPTNEWIWLKKPPQFTKSRTVSAAVHYVCAGSTDRHPLFQQCTLYSSKRFSLTTFRSRHQECYRLLTDYRRLHADHIPTTYWPHRTTEYPRIPTRSVLFSQPP